MALIQEAFGDHADLYSLLGVEKEATSAQIKKGYHKAALKWHPDKNQQQDATLKFQALGEVHRILSDADLRSEYDESGVVPDSESATKMNWSAYFAKIFKVGHGLLDGTSAWNPKWLIRIRISSRCWGRLQVDSNYSRLVLYLVLNYLQEIVLEVG
jgi:curved DNA-binding protein CbpA